MRVLTSLRSIGIMAATVFVLSGCAFFFTDGQRSIGVIPRESGSNVVFRTTLRGDTMGISFRCPASAMIGSDSSRVRVILTNSSQGKKINVTAKVPGRRIVVEPGARVCVYEGSLAGLMSEQIKEDREGGFGVRTESGRVPCQLEVRFLSGTAPSAPIEVLSYYSSTPL